MGVSRDDLRLYESENAHLQKQSGNLMSRNKKLARNFKY